MFLSSFACCGHNNFAKAESQPVYAKVVYENVFMFSLPDEKEENKLFEIPFSYFVLLHSSENEKFFYAQYGDIFGYVQKNAVSAMKGTPSTPFATSSFRVFSMEGQGLYKTPSMNGEKLVQIPYLSETLIFYGDISGDQVIPDKSNVWYFAKHTESGNFGYVYSVFCDKVSKIQENKETFETISTPLFSKDTSSDQLSPVAMSFIIIGVSLPCLIVLYLLVKPTMVNQKLIKTKEKLKGTRSRDYFEFDESDLN